MADIKYTGYKEEANRTPMDASVLEETVVGGVDETLVELVRSVDPFAFEDRDGDGFREVDKDVLESALEEYGFGSTSFPLATYFDDTINMNASVATREKISGQLKEIIKSKSLDDAREFFKKTAEESDCAVKDVLMPLEVFLTSFAVYDGLLENADLALDNENGFSVSADGRYRVNCQQFSHLAFQTLRNVPGIQCSFVSLIKDEGEPIQGSIGGRPVDRVLVDKKSNMEAEMDVPSESARKLVRGNHMMLLVSDSRGNNLLVDNGKASYFFSRKPKRAIQRKFTPSYKTVDFRPAKSVESIITTDYTDEELPLEFKKAVNKNRVNSKK